MLFKGAFFVLTEDNVTFFLPLILVEQLSVTGKLLRKPAEEQLIGST